jgi:hypothetical protein
MSLENGTLWIYQKKSPGGVQEARATAEGTYNQDTSQLLVRLDSSVRPFAEQSNSIQVDWLPESETIKVSISPSEAFEAVKENFRQLGSSSSESDPLGSFWDRSGRMPWRQNATPRKTYQQEL